MTNWYAIQVKAKSEVNVCSKILKRCDADTFIDCFVPQVEYVTKRGGIVIRSVSAMFPGYFFIVTDNIEKFHHQLMYITEFKRVLREDFQFLSIAEDERDMILALTGDDHVCAMSEGYIEGKNIYVTKGPLKGREGMIRKIDRHKKTAEVEMNFFGGIPTRVVMALEIVSKI